MRQTADIFKDKYPRVNVIINEDTFIEDIMSWEDQLRKASNVADDMEIVTRAGGFGLKGFTFSGKDPADKLTWDGKSISVAGMIWFSFSKDDKFLLIFQN